MILHFAPEEIVTSVIRDKSAQYVTADNFRKDCDFRLDISHMPQIKDNQFDVVIAFDVLEHVPDYLKALEEVHRILCSKGIAIYTVPQKDNLEHTYEDLTIVTPEDREKHFGHFDHLRIYGDDFSRIVENKGFSVTAVNESYFSEYIVRKHVLSPPILSKHPLATNYRKVFFCQKTQ
jgi:SAM-dependent methyltransferase